MSEHERRTGLKDEQRRERLRALGAKAKEDPQSLSIGDLDAIVDLVAKISVVSTTGPIVEQAKSPALEPFAALATEPHPRAEAQIYLRLAHAAEYIAARVYGLAKGRYEATVDARWKAEGGPTSGDA